MRVSWYGSVNSVSCIRLTNTPCPRVAGKRMRPLGRHMVTRDLIYWCFWMISTLLSGSELLQGCNNKGASNITLNWLLPCGAGGSNPSGVYHRMRKQIIKVSLIIIN